MLNFVLCDDNEVILERLSKMLESLFIKHELNAQVGFTSTNPVDVLNYAKNNSITALFLDIDLKSDLSGLDLAGKIREIDSNSYIIFTSAHLEYILTAYKYKTFDFLPKPITLERLEETFIRLVDDINSENDNSPYIKLNNKIVVKLDSIKFIKRDGMKLVFYTDGHIYEIYSSFAKIEKYLPKNFVRCHKSYIVNTNKITNIDTSKNIIFFDDKDKEYCYIGPKYKTTLMEVFDYDGNISNNMD